MPTINQSAGFFTNHRLSARWHFLRNPEKGLVEAGDEVNVEIHNYLCRNHPFVDDNKRAALGGWVVFLRLNGNEPEPDSPEWEALTLEVAASGLDREQTTKRLRKLLR
jgi:hypothetical protein